MSDGARWLTRRGLLRAAGAGAFGTLAGCTNQLPGTWLFHCHNLYHLDAGMARVVRYVE